MLICRRDDARRFLKIAVLTTGLAAGLALAPAGVVLANAAAPASCMGH